MRDKFNKFMQGRYGVDELSRFTMGAALVLIILTMFITMFNRNLGSIFDFLGIAAKFRLRFNKEKNLMKQRKTHHIYSCPGCGQKVRIPRGKGKIEIECPKCHTKFVKRS